MATIKYEMDGDGLREHTPVVTNETHSEFYGFENFAANHGYLAPDRTRVFVHKNDSANSFAVTITHHDNSGPDTETEGPDYVIDTNFSETVASSDFVVQDDPGSNTTDRYNPGSMHHEFDGTKTDGAMIKADTFKDVEFTISVQQSATSWQGIEFYDEANGTVLGNTLHMTFEGVTSGTPTTTTGDQVVMLENELAVHGKI